jgi:Uma2 family endonuclease
MSFLLRLSPIFDLSDAQFYELARVNRDLCLEQTVEGSLIVMAPTGWDVGIRNRRLTQQLGFWTDENGVGEAFDSSTGFQRNAIARCILGENQSLSGTQCSARAFFAHST